MLEKIYSMRAFTALRAKNFRIFIFGQSVSLIGTWMQRLAMSWLVLRLTGSGAGLGLIDISNQAPILITGFMAGTILDRFNVKKVLLVTQALCMLQALALAFLDFSGSIRYIQVFWLSLMLGLVTSIDLPARQAGVASMIDTPDQLNSALTINSVIFNIARLIGPALAGFMLQVVGEAACFLLNGISFMAVIYSVLKLKISETPAPKARVSGWRSLKGGMEYMLGFDLLFKMLVSSAVFFFLCLPYTTILPFFARNIFSSDASVLGMFLGCVGLGALAGVIFQASYVPVRQLHRQLVISITGYAFGMAVFAVSRSIYISCAALALVGFGLSTGSVGFNTLVQSIIDDDKRGRVMSIYTVGNIGIGPLGSLAAGAVADVFGGTFSALLLAFGSLLLALYIRSGYRRLDRSVLSVLRFKRGARTL